MCRPYGALPFFIGSLLQTCRSYGAQSMFDPDTSDPVERPRPKRYPESMEDEPAKQKSALKWTKRFGLAAFLFFLIKGLLWLIVPALIAYFAWN
jgi:hypothetical protein